MPNTTSTFRATLKQVLNKVLTDDEFSTKNTRMSECFEVRSMTDAYIDLHEYGGIGLAEYLPEGQSFSIGGVSPGTEWRFWARTFGKEMDVTEEAIADTKYPEAIKGRKRAIRALGKAVEYEAALVLDRMYDTNYAYRDGVPIASASHPLPGGGTFSNLFATVMAPSVATVTQAEITASGMVSYDGLIEPVMLKSIVAPKEQRSAWKRVLMSKLDVDSTNNFSAINVAKDMGLKLVINEYMQASTTNHFFKTDADDGLLFFFREKPSTRSWDGLDQRKLHFAAKARWAIGHANPRATIANGS